MDIALMGCPDRVAVITGWAGAAPVALLVRPDGYLAWAAADDAENPWSGAFSALHHWFGAEIGEKFMVTGSDEPVTRVGG